jgi:hypothetical protein
VLDRLDGDDGLIETVRRQLGDEPLSGHSAIVKDETKVSSNFTVQTCLWAFKSFWYLGF